MEADASSHASGESVDLIGDAINAADEADAGPGLDLEPGSDTDLAFVQDVLGTLQLPDCFAQRGHILLQHARNCKERKRLSQLAKAGVREDVKDGTRRRHKEFAARATDLIFIDPGDCPNSPQGLGGRLSLAVHIFAFTDRLFLR